MSFLKAHHGVWLNSLMAARCRYCAPFWVPLGLTSLCWRAAITADCDIHCLLIWQGIFHFSSVSWSHCFFRPLMSFCVGEHDTRTLTKQKLSHFPLPVSVWEADVKKDSAGWKAHILHHYLVPCSFQGGTDIQLQSTIWAAFVPSHFQICFTKRNAHWISC